MKMNMQPYKGSRDFYPEDKRLQKWMFDKWRRVVEKYGYEEYDAPILEPTELYKIKGSQEIIEEQTYTFLDRGGRSVTVRTEMTPTVSRMIAAQRQELQYPVRWYSIPNIWRYERMQRGRLREFWQLNVDLFGISGLAAELEMLQITDDIFQSFKAHRKDYVIKLNSRVFVQQLFERVFGMDSNETTQLIRLIDKFHKSESVEFVSKLDEITKNHDESLKMYDLLNNKFLEELPENVKKLPGISEITELLTRAKNYGISNIEFDITLMRGFDYYTDVVFEVFDTDAENNRSMFGGGRYDGLIGEFGVEPLPTVGFGMGDVTFMNFLETHGLLPDLKPTTEAILIIRDAGSVPGAEKAAHELREMGANVSVDYSERKIDKQFKSALKTGICYAIFVGREEIASEQYILKDLKTSKEEKHSLQRIVSIVKDNRKR